MTDEAPKTFLITGVSSGLGRAFAAGALAAGHRVIGTVRKQDDADTFAAQDAGPVLDSAGVIIVKLSGQVEIGAPEARADSAEHLDSLASS